MTPAELILAEVAEELSWVMPAPVFIGGATIGLFLDELGRDQLRPTKDINCIVPAVLNRADWYHLEGELRARGWQPDVDGPVCRYRSPRGHAVDLLGARPEIQGFAGAWFERAAAHTRQHVLTPTLTILTPTVPYLVACKIEAFRDRGAADPMASTDFEDLVALLDGCIDLETSVTAAEEDVRAFIAEWCAGLLADRSLIQAADGQLPRGGDFDGRRQRLRARLERLASLITR